MCLFATTAWLACSSGDDSRGPGSGGPDVLGPGTGSRDGGPPPPERAEFGLDTRPLNATCKAPPRPVGGGSVKLEPAFTGVTFNRPIALAQPPGDKSRWFVAQRDGVIVSFPSASPPANPGVVADVAALAGRPIHQDLEGGFLNIAFHPRFADNGRVYVSFTTDGVSQTYGSEIGYITTTNGGASFTSYTRVLHYDRPALEHNGGGLAFGKDGFLYIGFGDGNMSRTVQDKQTFFGKILRIDVDNVPAGKTYGIPADNPFASGGGRPEIFAWGFRNPYRFSIDRETGELWEGDVGDAMWEEVNLVERGANHGWPCREGKHDKYIDDPELCPNPTGLVDPIVEHEHPTANTRSITGGIVYRGASMPWFHGTYVYADFIQLEAWALSFDAATGAVNDRLINETGPVAGFSSFAEDGDGEIYALALFQDSAFKLVPASPPDPGATPFPDKLSLTGCVDPADPKKPAAGLIPYGVNAQLFSDGADKQRFIALPDGASIPPPAADGDLDLPVGSVLVKSFSRDGKMLETRLLVRHDDGDWGGYSYEWNDEQTDATLLTSGKTNAAGWTFPSRSDCMRCHTTGAGRTLGLELGQLDGDFVYPSTNRIANQLKTLEHIGIVPAGTMASPHPVFPAPFGDAPLEVRARAYLHANCGNCHRPEGGAPRADFDLRFGLSFADTRLCGKPALLDDLGIADAKLLSPGQPQESVISRRIHATDAKRMPPLARRVVDADGAKLIDDWIGSVQSCP